MDTLKEITKLAESLKVKTCTKCGKTKHGDEININQSWCKACKKEYRVNNKEKVRSAQKKWYKENKEKCNNRSRNHYQKNKAKMIGISKKYREKNKDDLLKKRKSYKEKHKNEINLKARKYNKNIVRLITVGYLKRRIKVELKLNYEDITPEMIEIKRAQITLKRLIAQ